MSYRVDLDIYSGPMDLLLYLIRREEVDITDLPIARIADQYVAYLDMLASLDIELAGEFVVMAATLLELKSRALLPRPTEIDEDEEEGETEDPRETLIRQLIEYRRFKEAASHLDGLGRDMAKRFPRQFDDLLLKEVEQEADDGPPEDVLQGVQVWDLIGAFGNIMRTVGYSKPREVVYDDTPVEEVGKELIRRLEREKSVLFTQLFEGGRSLTYCIAMFLAILELVRQRRIGAEQQADFKDVRIFLRDPSDEPPPKARRPKGAKESREALKRKRPRRPSAGQINRMRELMDEVELEKTEFDEILDSIQVPDVEAFHPIYSEQELLGRPDTEETDDTQAPAAEAGSPDAAPAEEAGAPAEGEPGDGPPPDATPSESDEEKPDAPGPAAGT